MRAEPATRWRILRAYRGKPAKHRANTSNRRGPATKGTQPTDPLPSPTPFTRRPSATTPKRTEDRRTRAPPAIRREARGAPKGGGGQHPPPPTTPHDNEPEARAPTPCRPRGRTCARPTNVGDQGGGSPPPQCSIASRRRCRLRSVRTAEPYRSPAQAATRRGQASDPGRGQRWTRACRTARWGAVIGTARRSCCRVTRYGCHGVG
jgi:hypothetical protein